MPEIDLRTLVGIFPWMTLLGAAAIATGAILLLVPVARRAGWVDKPSGRKVHEGEIPLVGGWAVLLAIAALQIAGPAEARVPVGYWVGGILLFAVALVDDRHPVRARYRLVVQVVAAIAGVSLGGQVLPDLGNLLGTGVLSSWWIVAPVSVVGIVAMINAVNFTDGADGLCGGLGFISLFWFAVAIALATTLAGASGGQVASFAPSLIPLIAAMMGGLAGFLFFNQRSPWLKRAVVFMGDSGSMLLGFTAAWLAIHATSAFGAASVDPVVCLWIMAVPLADLVSCIVRRILEGSTPMTPDLKHLHNLVRRSGLTIGQSVAAIQAGAFLCGMIGVCGWWTGVPEHWMFGGFLLAVATFVCVTNLAWRRFGMVQQLAQAG